MPAATTKSQLIETTEKEYAALCKLLDGLSPDLALRGLDETGISARELVGQRGQWIELFFGWYADGQAGKRVHMPARGYKWSETPALNAEIHRAQHGLSWANARALLDGNHARLMQFILRTPDADLYGAGMPGIDHKWTLGRWVEATGAAQYRSARVFLRKGLRRAQG